MEVVLRLESSSKWPDELEAVRSTGTAFLIRLAQCFEKKVKRREETECLGRFIFLCRFCVCVGVGAISLCTSGSGSISLYLIVYQG